MKKFNLDRANAMFLGVCAGIAEYTGINATAVRIGAVVLTLLGGFPWTFIAYGAIAWAAKPKDHEWGSTASRDARREVSDMDHRISEIDSYVSAPNAKLAREIEALRNS